MHAPAKQMYDPYKETEQLQEMIPSIRTYTNVPLASSSPSKSDLTYKIVKTADNNLSIIKKNEPLSKNDDGDSGEKPTTKLDISNKRKSLKVSLDKDKLKKIKSDDKISNSLEGDHPIKVYHVIRRGSSDPIDSDESSKIKTVIIKRKSESKLEPVSSPPIVPSKKRRQSKLNERNLLNADELTKNLQITLTPITISKKAKRSSVASKSPTKHTLPSTTTVLNTDTTPSTNIIQSNTDQNISIESKENEINVSLTASSESSIEIIRAPSPSDNLKRTKSKEDESIENVVEPIDEELQRKTNQETDITNLELIEPTEHTNKEIQNTINKSIESDENLLIPMESVKKEVIDDCPITINESQTNERNNISSRRTVSLPLNDHTIDPLDLANVKSEPDAENVETNSSVNHSSFQLKSIQSLPVRIENVNMQRGNITVKDISKLKNPVIRRSGQITVRAFKQNGFSKIIIFFLLYLHLN